MGQVIRGVKVVNDPARGFYVVIDYENDTKRVVFLLWDFYRRRTGARVSARNMERRLSAWKDYWPAVMPFLSEGEKNDFSSGGEAHLIDSRNIKQGHTGTEWVIGIEERHGATNKTIPLTTKAQKNKSQAIEKAKRRAIEAALTPVVEDEEDSMSSSSSSSSSSGSRPPNKRHKMDVSGGIDEDMLRGIVAEEVRKSKIDENMLRVIVAEEVRKAIPEISKAVITADNKDKWKREFQSKMFIRMAKGEL